ncbi:MAG TPA: hypothetical protein VJO35_08670 [Terriglobales bacterium]|nr:hypothetical protein [Terriglobales bacterium]
MRFRTGLGTLVFGFVLSSLVAQAPSPSVRSFAGGWVLNPQKSTLSQSSSRPDRVELSVTQASNKIGCEWRFTSRSDGATLTLNFTTDGNESRIPSTGKETALRTLAVPAQSEPALDDIKVTSKWVGQELSVQTHWMNRNKIGIELDDRWRLSADRNTLTLDRTSVAPDASGRTEETHGILVFERVKN